MKPTIHEVEMDRVFYFRVLQWDGKYWTEGPRKNGVNFHLPLTQIDYWRRRS